MTQTVGQDTAQQSKAKVFISYSRKDIGFVDRLEAALKVRGFDPLIDRAEIYAFEEWWKRIEALIVRADTVVFVLSPESVASEVALKEVAFAASLNKRFAPIVYRAVNDKAVPEALAKLNFVFFDDATQFEASADRLVEALDTDIAWIRQHTEFGEQARRWALAGQPRGLFLHSPALEQAERWIAARPPGAPPPTEETQSFIGRSRQAATRRRNILTGSLTAGLVLALGLAGLAYWQRGIAVQNEALAREERDRATRNFQLAQSTAENVIFDIAQSLRAVQGLSAETVRKILETSRATFEQLANSAPNDLGLQRSRAAMLIEFGATYQALGDLGQALKAYSDGLAISERLVAAEPGNIVWQHSLMLSYGRVASILVDQGKLDEALKASRNKLEIAVRLAADGNNARLQSDLAASHHSVGNILRAQGQTDEALKAYRAALVIRERLVATDRNDTGWQRELSGSFDVVGDMLRAQGQLDEALKSYLRGLEIRQRLVAADPGNTQSQLGLALSHDRHGDVLLDQGKLNEALKAYLDSLATRMRLAASDPSNAQWQRDLAVSYDKVGQVYRILKRFDEAHKAHRDAVAIRERLVAVDPSNTQWRHDLSVSYGILGGLFQAQGRRDEALKVYRDGLAIAERLVAIDRTNAQWQRDLAQLYDSVGEVLEAQGKLEDAFKAYLSGLVLAQRLANADRANAGWQVLLQASIASNGNIAYGFVLNRKYATALLSVDQVIAIVPSQIVLYAIRAHALMFLGRVDEARALYLRHRGEKAVIGEKAWDTVILETFAELRQAGLTHPLMAEIGRVFAAR